MGGTPGSALVVAGALAVLSPLPGCRCGKRGESAPEPIAEATTAGAVDAAPPRIRRAEIHDLVPLFGDALLLVEKTERPGLQPPGARAAVLRILLADEVGPTDPAGGEYALAHFPAAGHPAGVRRDRYQLGAAGALRVDRLRETVMPLSGSYRIEGGTYRAEVASPAEGWARVEQGALAGPLLVAVSDTRRKAAAPAAGTTDKPATHVVEQASRALLVGIHPAKCAAKDLIGTWRAVGIRNELVDAVAELGADGTFELRWTFVGADGEHSARGRYTVDAATCEARLAAQDPGEPDQRRTWEVVLRPDHGIGLAWRKQGATIAGATLWWRDRPASSVASAAGRWRLFGFPPRSGTLEIGTDGVIRGQTDGDVAGDPPWSVAGQLSLAGGRFSGNLEARPPGG